MTNNEAMNKVIIDLVTEFAPIKGTTLAAKTIQKFSDVFGQSILSETLEEQELSDVFAELEETGEIVELEYVLPNSHRIKSLYFPKGTEFPVFVNDDGIDEPNLGV